MKGLNKRSNLKKYKHRVIFTLDGSYKVIFTLDDRITPLLFQIEKEVPLLGLPTLLKAVNKIQLSDTRY